jgi:hypothetical protein
VGRYVKGFKISGISNIWFLSQNSLN